MLLLLVADNGQMMFIQPLNLLLYPNERKIYFNTFLYSCQNNEYSYSKIIQI